MAISLVGSVSSVSSTKSITVSPAAVGDLAILFVNTVSASNDPITAIADSNSRFGTWNLEIGLGVGFLYGPGQGGTSAGFTYVGNQFVYGLACAAPNEYSPNFTLSESSSFGAVAGLLAFTPPPDDSNSHLTCGATRRELVNDDATAQGH